MLMLTDVDVDRTDWWSNKINYTSWILMKVILIGQFFLFEVVLKFYFIHPTFLNQLIVGCPYCLYWSSSFLWYKTVTNRQFFIECNKICFNLYMNYKIYNQVIVWVLVLVFIFKTPIEIIKWFELSNMRLATEHFWIKMISMSSMHYYICSYI